VTPTITLSLSDGARIVVPDSVDLITPYVLMEQHDWFEDEIKFVRRLLRPGQKAIDIGANYGVYTLAMAQCVGQTGHVWAFEPASGTARLLAESIAANGFAQIVLEQIALSHTVGTARLSLQGNSELNALVRDRNSATASEPVCLSTLDEQLERCKWSDIDLVKIDAEGEEANILKGGRRFFSALSPLVQYEVKAGDKLHLTLVRDFSELGYESYRFVPGLNLLVPFEITSIPDPYLLNLFSCKNDRAKLLARAGLLLEVAPSQRCDMEDIKQSEDRREYREAFDWRERLPRLPYGDMLADTWEQTMAAEGSRTVEEALSSYAASRELSLSPADRFSALQTSYRLLVDVCEHDPSYLRFASLARVARDYGARSVAVNALHQLNERIARDKRVDPREPFLAPGERFDAISPRGEIGNWLLAALLEEFERLGSYSSFYTGTSALDRLKLIRRLGYGSEEMERRLLLVQRRFRLPAS
jgi:FkbM family methyltransferase